MKRFQRSQLEKIYPALVLILIGYAIADLVILNYRDLMLPSQAPPARPQKLRTDNYIPKSTYSTIITRNIFNSEGIIPDALVPAGTEKRNHNEEAEPVPSNLPLALQGTIVHSNPTKSIANVELKGKNTVLAYHPGNEIDKVATLIKVERNKIIIRNISLQRLEFIDTKSVSKINFSSPKPTSSSLAPPASNEVAQTAPGKFSIKRSNVLKYTNNMGEVLQQAAMVPKRGASGEIEGFKFLSIQPNSIYTQLGFQPGDTIKSVNGELVDSPAKAMELYNQLKSSNDIKMRIERDGHDQDHDYSITD